MYADAPVESPSPDTQVLAQPGAVHAQLPSPVPVTLRDGSSAWLRPAARNDIPLLSALFERASRESLWRRFFTPRTSVDPRLIELMADADGNDRLTLLITRGEGEDEIALAVGGYARGTRPESAEVAFLVDDAYEGRGLGTLLLEHLADYARRHGISRFVADVQSDNSRMLDVFRRSGFRLDFTGEQGSVHIGLPLAMDEGRIVRTEEREWIATTASLTPFFKPRSVAVIGASRDRASIGRRVFENLLDAGFDGPVYPINPTARSVGSVRAYASILAVPDEVDLAVVVVPAARVLPVVDECARKRVRALIVVSAGFAETGPEGRALQDALVRTVRGHGMRMVGPNCLGLLNTDLAVSLNATFAPTFPPRGRVAMSSQSGALGLAILDYAGQLGLGLSTFVAVGNKADVSGNDLLRYWESDPNTDLVILYLESFGNPRKFARIARRVSRHKPILAVKSGRSAVGARAAHSHTAALAGSDRAVDALFRQAGVIRAETLEELFDVASVLASQPLPAGNRVAIVTNAGGPGVMAADACDARRLVVPEFSAPTHEALRRLLPATAGLGNPVDMIASASAEHYEGTVRHVLLDENVDALIVIFIPTGVVGGEDVAAAIRRAAEEAGTASGREKPVLACFMSSQGMPPALAGGDGTTASVRPIPSFRFPESAARALARTIEYADWQRRPAGRVPDLDRTDAASAHRLVDSLLQDRGGGWLQPDETSALLATAGIVVLPFTLASTPEEAGRAAEGIGYPVAVKAVSEQLLHKSDAGGVKLGLMSAMAVRDACAVMQMRITPPPDRFLVQGMSPSGAELIVGVTEDENFGPLVAFGLGGTAVEVLNDIVFRITPLTDRDAQEMVRSIRGLPLLQGFRGAPAIDLGVIEELLLRLSWLVEELPQIAELDLNPVIASAAGLAVVDARVRLKV
jgi:acetate---CoA ligase (ADP-forming)